MGGVLQSDVRIMLQRTSGAPSVQSQRAGPRPRPLLRRRARALCPSARALRAPYISHVTPRNILADSLVSKVVTVYRPLLDYIVLGPTHSHTHLRLCVTFTRALSHLRKHRENRNHPAAPTPPTPIKSNLLYNTPQHSDIPPSATC